MSMSDHNPLHKKDGPSHKKDGQAPDPQGAQSSLAKLAESSEVESPVGLMHKLRNYFLAGLIVVGPILLTLYSVWTVVTWIDNWVKPYLPSMPESFKIQTYIPITLPDIPGVGLVFAVFALMVVGALLANLFGQTLFSYSEMMLNRMPIVRNVYRALKQIFETVLSKSGGTFQKAGLIEYPRKGIYTIVFISKETTGEVAKKFNKEGDPLISVFVPTTPNPTSGFLLFLPRSDVQILDMTVEEAVKLVISAGLVEPENNKKLPDKNNDVPAKEVLTQGSDIRTTNSASVS